MINVYLVNTVGTAFASGALIAAAVAVALVAKSFKDFSQTGPELRKEITAHYRLYTIFATARLAGWAFVIAWALTVPGALMFLCATLLFDRNFGFPTATLYSSVSVALLIAFQFCRHLLYIPASIAASYNYRQSRLYPLWHLLSPHRIRLAGRAILLFGNLVIIAVAVLLIRRNDPWPGLALLMLASAMDVTTILLTRSREPRPVRGQVPARPNIVMIGSDTLRADRLGNAGYRRPVTPFIDLLAARGTEFTTCYVPCARTAPSLISLLTGVWPHSHGIRDNFVGDGDAKLDVEALPSILRRHGYRTAAVSDWSGGDLRKFSFGFEVLDLPDDQWNIKYLIRQGSKDLRLFLSLFTHNRFGKWALPELYYLAGVPLTRPAGRDARELISKFSARGEPFFLNVFVSTTHPPFGSEYPYYTLWSNRSYAGESKFVMARLTDPWEIIRRQGDSKSEFELDQIIDLYDGCVRNFDDEVKRIVEHIDACGLRENTLLVIYSDHGMEFFEHDTWGQGNSVRADASMRVPMIFVDPRLPGGLTCSKTVRSIDVVPTLLESVGVAIPAAIEGVSLRSYLKDPTAELNLPAFNETGIWLTDLPGMPSDHLRYPNLLDLLEVPDKRTGTLAIKAEFRQAIIAAKDRMIRLGPWKLTYQPTYSGAIYSLFNVMDDPQCHRDVSVNHPDVVRDLRARLEAWMSFARA